MKRRARPGTPGRYSPPRRRPVRRLLFIVLFGSCLVALSTATFIGTRCYGQPAGNESRPRGDVPEGIATYVRPEAFTYLTLPEWFIVYSTDEYARFIQKSSPSDFPYLGSVGQYWGVYGAMCQATRAKYPFETEHHMILGIIGASFTLENVVKAAYENTVGRLSEWISSRNTPEDRFAAKVSAEYGTSIHTVPWYEFGFATRLHRLWTEVPLTGPNLFRKWERRLALSSEYAVKAIYGFVLGLAARVAYGAEATKVYARVEEASVSALRDSVVEKVAPTPGGYVVRLPRYEAFTRTMLPLLTSDVRFVDVAGNDQILVTALAPSALNERALRTGTVIASFPVLTERGRKRIAMRIPVAQLHRAVAELRNASATIEHLYDY